MATVREVEDDDISAVAALLVAEGWGAPAERDWHWLWRENPALEAAHPAPARGWVLIDDRSTVGFLGNVVQRYRLGDRSLLAATATSMVVAPDHRGSSLQLTLAFTKQHGIDVLMNTTAAPHVSKISEFLRFRRIPQADYDRSFYWVLRARPFAVAALRKKRVPAWLAGFSGLFLGPAMALEGAVRRRNPRHDRSRVRLRTIDVDSIGAEFDDLWQRKLTEPARLFAVRDARTLRWHFGSRGRRNPAFLVCAHEGERLVGYIAIVRQDAAHLGLARARVADLFVEHDDVAVIRSLLAAAAARARVLGAAMLEMIGFPSQIRRLAQAFHPFELLNESWPFLFKTRDRALEEHLASEGAWYASLFDGDGSL